MLKRKIFKILTITLLITSTNIWSAENNNTPNIAKFISVADIHFDPLAGCEKPCPLANELRKAKYQDWEKIFEKSGNQTLSQYYRDTSYQLLKAMLAELQQVNKQENPAFVLILGDFIAHKFRHSYIRYTGDTSQEGYRQFVKKTLQFLTFEFEQVFPKIDVYPVVGNNDTYSEDYEFIPDGSFFKDLAGIWAPLIKDKKNQANFKKEFPYAGYYHVTLPTNQNQQMLILNSVLFSARNFQTSTEKAAATELEWLNKELQNSSENNLKMMLAYHIPVGIDIFATFKAKFANIEEFWKPLYTSQFEKELKNYPNTVTAMFAGHIHMDHYQALTLKRFFGIPVIITPSISPIFGNSPGFKVFGYNPLTLEIEKVEEYQYSLNQKVPATVWEKDVVMMSAKEKMAAIGENRN